jgi:hypothetical protein
MYKSEGLPVHVIVTIQVTRVSLVTVTHTPGLGIKPWMGRGGLGENKGAFSTPPHKPLRCPAWHK